MGDGGILDAIIGCRAIRVRAYVNDLAGVVAMTTEYDARIAVSKRLNVEVDRTVGKASVGRFGDGVVDRNVCVR
jgi:hypothetical protein